MASRRWCALAAALLLLPGVLQGQPTGPKPAGNAALQYWLAFAALNEFTDAEEKLFESWKSGPPPKEAQDRLAADQAALRALRRGAKTAACDWGLYYEDGPGLLLPYLQKARSLARRACLNARAHFEQRQPAEAIEDILATLTLARHVGSDGTMISLLVQFAIESVAIEAAAPYLTGLDRASLKRLQQGLESLPPGGNVKSTLRLEREHMLGWLVRQVKAKVGAETLDKILAPDVAFAELLKRAGGRDGILKQLQEVEPYYDEMEKILSLPADEQQAQFALLAKKAETNPFAKMLLPAIDKVLQADAKARTRLALFRAALAVVQGGPERLKDHPDPAGKGPFEHQKLDQGFELKSKLIDARGQRVTLRVGAR